MNRREALAMLAAATGSIAVPAYAQQSPAAGAAQPRIARRGRIKQGLWRVNFGTDTKLTFDEICREAARLGCYGFDLIDPADWLCSDQLCPGVDDKGRPLYKDASHLRASVARERFLAVDRYLYAR